VGHIAVKGLTCPCTHISIGYDSFFNIHYSVHQVCQSIFISQIWIDYLTLPFEYMSSVIFESDFKRIGSFLFQDLNSFCQLTNETISNNRLRFDDNQYVSMSLVSSQVFRSQTDLLTNEFISSTKSDFISSLDLIRDTTHGNNILSAHFLNYRLLYLDGFPQLFPEFPSYSNCHCTSSS
jgi:hypothetical protein